ncbi:MAG: helix-turn-helix domain-containing protein, partial [Thermoplasmata archaeon]
MPSVRQSLTTQERVLLHLLRFYNVKGEYIVPEGVTQQGIADAVGTTRSNLPQTLKKLISQGLVEQSTGRVEKIGSKRSVYTLTPSGIQHAKKIRDNIMQLKVTAIESEPGRLERKKREFTLFDLYNYLEGKYPILEILKYTHDGLVDLDALKNKDIPKKVSFSYAPADTTNESKSDEKNTKKEYGSILRTES